MFCLLDRVTLFIIVRYTGWRSFRPLAAASKVPGTLALARAGRYLYRNLKVGRVLLRLDRMGVVKSLRDIELAVYTIALAETLREEEDELLRYAGNALPN